MRTQSLTFGYRSNPTTDRMFAQNVANFVNTQGNAVPVGVEMTPGYGPALPSLPYPGMPLLPGAPTYQVVTNQEYWQAYQGGRLLYTSPQQPQMRPYFA